MTARCQQHRPTLTRHHDDAGLSLVEMVVAIGVVVVVLLSAGAALLRMSEAQRTAEGTDRGTQLVQDQLEQIRKTPYALVGCYDLDAPCPTNAPAGNPVTAASGELVVHLGSIRPAGSPAPVPVRTVTVGGNVFTVATTVTFAGVSSAVGYPATLAAAPYAAKRVQVTATWTLAGTTRTLTREWLRSPTDAELDPAGGVTTGRCPEQVVVPFCVISIPEGSVVSPAPFLQANRPIVITATMSAPVTTATLRVGSVTQAMAISNGGLTVTSTIPTGTPVGAGPGQVTVWIDATTTLGTTTATRVVTW